MNHGLFKTCIHFIAIGICLVFISYFLETTVVDGIESNLNNGIISISKTLNVTGKVITLLSAVILGATVFYESNELKAERKKQQVANKLRDEYNNGLYGTLEQFLTLPATNEDSEILNNFYNLANMILATGKGEFAKENMQFFNSEADNEILALQEVLKTINKNIPITDEMILSTLQQITARLQKHYNLYYQQNLEGVKEELYVLTKLEK